MSTGSLIDLADAREIPLVGGKAAGLGALLRGGFRVPAGFCITTEAHRRGEVPDLAAAYERLGGGPVAVRSSATGEDLPEASFAGQQDTFLHVEGLDALAAAVRACWESIHSERAVAYRRDTEFSGPVEMAVVVQRMVEPRAAGVLFTADPVTGCRERMVVDAVAGLGTGVVEGSADSDHYVLDGPPGPAGGGGTSPAGGDAAGPAGGGCLSATDLTRLRELGDRVQRYSGAPQDIEWAFDQDGQLWVLQSRAITALFPLPPQDGPQPRAYFEVGHMQGMLRPCTPAGMSALQLAATTWMSNAGATGSMGMVGIGGRMYLDVTDVLRSRAMRRNLPQLMQTYGPRCVGVAERLLEDPRFAPDRVLPMRMLPMVRLVLRLLPQLVAGFARALRDPAGARERAFRCTERIRRRSVAPDGLDTAGRLRFAEQVQREFLGPDAMADLMGPLFSGLLAAQVPRALLRGLATDDEFETVLGGLPHNVTTEMDLELWRLADALEGATRELVRDTDPDELAARYRRGQRPDIGLDDFLARYGHRAAAEIDVGVPRWAENPAPIFATLAGYLRITDPAQAPDRRFRQAAERATAKIDELLARARPRRPLRARAAGFFLHRTRELAGLRELGKFAWLFPLAAMRRQILLAGEELSARGLLQEPADIFFLELADMRAAARGTDHRDRIAERKSAHRRESRRRHVPIALLSDGTDLEAAGPAPEPGEWTGLGAAPGRATGRARIVRDPARARVEPGEILVAPTTDPGWTPLFLSAAGLVTETGSAMAHGPTVAREYGIPAVLCLRGATERISDGALITIDGAAGTVTFESEQD